MNLSFKSTNWIAIIAAALLAGSCNKEEGITTKNWGQKLQDIEVRKDFELRSEWLPEDFQPNLKSTNPEVYNIFGVGLNSVDGRYEGSIIENRNDEGYMEVINRFAREDSDQEFIVSSSYSEIDKNTSSKLAASMGIDLRVFDLDASLSVERQSDIQNKTSHMYVSIMRYRKYGYAHLVETHSRINEYLTYNTNHGSPGSSTCNVPGSSAWKLETYGDRYIHGIHLGYIVNATVQITNVDYQSSSRSAVEGEVKAAVKRVFNGETTWSNIQSSNSKLANSEIVIRAKAIPSIDMVYTFDQLKEQIAELDKKFTNKDFGTIAIETKPYSVIYPSCSFINLETYKLKKLAWQRAKLYLQGMRTAAISDQALTTRINNEINICNTNINKCFNHESGIPNPGSYENLYTDVLKIMSPCLIKRIPNGFQSRSTILTTTGSGGTILGQGHRSNIEPEKLIPIYLTRKPKFPFQYNSTTDDDGSWNISFYIYDYKYDNNMVPLVRWETMIVHGYQNPLWSYNHSTTTPPNTSYRWAKPTILGYVYEN